MLQQTQVSRALPKYIEFLHAFPSVVELSNSPLSTVLQVWKGMGYNRRAQYLQKTAREVVHTFNGHFPTEETQLLTLPGIGLYTARAIQVFAWKKDVAMVDTNIRQIITHYFFEGIVQSPKVTQETADLLVPKCKSWEWHQALMDFGSIAMPQIRKQEGTSDKTVKKNTVAFKDSPRYIRGRIIDLLRDGPQTTQILCEHIAVLYEKPEAFVRLQLDALVRESLVEEFNSNGVRLSES
jgi:A/G-specific adenine glycosylase